MVFKPIYYRISMLFDGTECVLKDGPFNSDNRVIVVDPREVEQLGGVSQAVCASEVQRGFFSLRYNRRKYHDLMMTGAKIVLSKYAVQCLEPFLLLSGVQNLPVNISAPGLEGIVADYIWLFSDTILWERPFPHKHIFQYSSDQGLAWVVSEELVNKITEHDLSGFRFTEIVS